MKLFHSLLIVTLLGTLSAYGAIYSEDFESFTLGSIDGQDGWKGLVSAQPAPGSIISGSVGDFGGLQVFDLAGDWNGRDITLPSDTFYYGFSLNIANRTGPTTANETFFRLQDWSTFIKIDARNDLIESAIGGSTEISNSVGLSEGSSVRLVGKLTWNSGAGFFDSHSVYLNPTGVEGDNTALAMNTNLSTLSGGTTYMTIRNDDTDTTIDNLIFTTSFAEAIPEPGVVGLLGLGCILMIWYRRHIRA